MRKNNSTIFTLIACLLMVLVLFQIYELKSQVLNLQDALSTQVSNVNLSMDNMYSNLNASIREQTRLISDSLWTFGEVNFDDMTVMVHGSVMPKSYTVNTRAKVVVDDAEYTMVLGNSGEFKTDFEIPIYSDTVISRVVFQDGESIQTEVLNQYLMPQKRYLLDVDTYLGGQSSGYFQNGAYFYHREGIVNVEAYSKGITPINVNTVTLVAWLDDALLSETDIPLDNIDFYENYQGENEAMPEKTETARALLDDGVIDGPFFYALDENYEIPKGSVLTLYVEIQDDNDLIYRSVIDRVEIDEKGNRIEDDRWPTSVNIGIYAANGKVIQAMKPEL